MRKLKLICLSSIIVLPSVFAVASCGENYVEPVDMVDIRGYESKINPYHIEELWISKEEATDAYVAAATENPEIFIDDMLCAGKILVDAQAEHMIPSLNLVEATFGVSKPKFGKTSSWYIQQEDKESPTISFSLRCHLSFQTPESITDKKIIQDVDINIDYHDVIFTLCEDVTNDGGWNIGFFDWNMDEEYVWPIMRNVNSWSINYDITRKQVEVLSGGPNRHDIVINNTSYFSGILNNAIILSTLLNAKYETPLEIFATNLILLGCYDNKYDHKNNQTRFFQSHYFKNIVFEPSIRIYQQMEATNNLHDTKVTNLIGLKLIAPKQTAYPDFSIESVNMVGDGWKLYADDGSNYYFTINNGAKFDYDSTTHKLTCNQSFNLNNSYNLDSQIGKHGFIFPYRTMPFQIKYKDLLCGANSQTINVGVDLLYFNMILNVLGNS